MGDLGKGIVATFLRVECWRRDYVDLDHSGRRVYRNQSSSCRNSSAHRASGCIHSGDGAFPGDVAGIAASAGRVKYRRCAPMLMGTQWYLLFNVIAERQLFRKIYFTRRICSDFHRSTAGVL